jgi:hypothetical protein
MLLRMLGDEIEVDVTGADINTAQIVARSRVRVRVRSAQTSVGTIKPARMPSMRNQRRTMFGLKTSLVTSS